MSRGLTMMFDSLDGFQKTSKEIDMLLDAASKNEKDAEIYATYTKRLHYYYYAQSLNVSLNILHLNI